MKKNGASAYLEARLIMPANTKTVNYNCVIGNDDEDGDDERNISLNRQIFIKNECFRIHKQKHKQQQQQQKHQLAVQATTSTMSISIMFQILYISMVYLLFTTNVVFTAAFETPDGGGGVGGGSGNELFRFMSLASDVSAATEFGEYFIFMIFIFRPFHHIISYLTFSVYKYWYSC